MVKNAETRQKILRAILRDKIMLTYFVIANCNSFSLNTLMQQAHHLNNSANQLTIIYSIQDKNFSALLQNRRNIANLCQTALLILSQYGDLAY